MSFKSEIKYTAIDVFSSTFLVLQLTPVRSKTLSKSSSLQTRAWNFQRG